MDERFLRNEMLWGKEGQARLTSSCSDWAAWAAMWQSVWPGPVWAS